MTAIEFIKWLKGFSEGVHHYNITPQQWEHLKENLKKVDNETKDNSYRKPEGWFTTNT